MENNHTELNENRLNHDISGGKKTEMKKKKNHTERGFSCMNVNRLGYIEHECLHVSMHRDGLSRPVAQAALHI